MTYTSFGESRIVEWGQFTSYRIEIFFINRTGYFELDDPYYIKLCDQLVMPFIDYGLSYEADE